MFSCHFFLISSASASSILFLSFIVPIFAWNVFLVSLIFSQIIHCYYYPHCFSTSTGFTFYIIKIASLIIHISSLFSLTKQTVSLNFENPGDVFFICSLLHFCFCFFLSIFHLLCESPSAPLIIFSLWHCCLPPFCWFSLYHLFLTVESFFHDHLL